MDLLTNMIKDRDLATKNIQKIANYSIQTGEKPFNLKELQAVNINWRFLIATYLQILKIQEATQGKLK